MEKKERELICFVFDASFIVEYLSKNGRKLSVFANINVFKKVWADKKSQLSAAMYG